MYYELLRSSIRGQWSVPTSLPGGRRGTWAEGRRPGCGRSTWRRWWWAARASARLVWPRCGPQCDWPRSQLARGKDSEGKWLEREDVLVSTVHWFQAVGGLLPYVLCPAAPFPSSCAAAAAAAVTPGQQEVESHGCRDPTGLDRETARCGSGGIGDARGSGSPHGRGSWLSRQKMNMKEWTFAKL